MYTPRAPSRSSHVTHSTKQISKITSTIASARRTRGAPEEDPDDQVTEASRGRRHSSRRTTRDAQESSFIAESSFVQNPLNSRLGPRPSATKGKGRTVRESLKGVPLEIQEAFILEDLLFVLMGIPGTYIVHHPDHVVEDDNLQGATFVVTDHLDPSLRDLLDRVLPLATYYTAIASFIELRSHTDYGLVNHALCAAIRDMLNDYLTLISQLEHAFVSSSTFTLQKLWFYVHPTLHTLSILYALITELVRVEDPDIGKEASDEDDDEDEDEEEEERNKALGLGGLKAVIKDMLSSSGGLVKGGEVVAILWERMRNHSGDPTAYRLYHTLLGRASLPYVQMLKTWTTSGNLRDPYDELMVKETKSINRGTLDMDFIDEYWEKRYTLRDGSSMNSTGKRPQAGVPLIRAVTGRLPGGACIPPLLEGWKHKILLAGKYLNVIRECGIDIQQPVDEEEAWILDGEKFYKGIEETYTYANRTLLKQLTEDQQLLPRLRAMKSYFFLSQSAFLTHFLELAGPELRKTPKNAPIVKLQSLLDLSLNMNFSGDEVAFTYKEDVKVSLATSGLYEWLLKIVSLSGFTGFGTEDGGEMDFGAGSGSVGADDAEKKREKEKEKKLTTIDVLALDFSVPFPLSLVISRKAILRYQLLFRFILHLKHIEQSLCQMWIDHKSSPWKVSLGWHPELERWRRRVVVLRARMLSVVQQILAYATTEVLEPNWRNLETKLGKVITVDQLLRDHVDFLDTCLKECMLTNAKILKIHAHLLQTCFTFTQYSSSFTKPLSSIIEAYAESGEDVLTDEHFSMEKRWSFLHKFEHNFNHYFKIHHDCVQFLASSENTALLALVVRLNNIRTL